MALWFFARVRFRRVVLGMAAAVAVATLPDEAAATPEPQATGKAYVAFFLGQGGYLFSWGIPHLAAEARKLGLATDVFSYTDVTAAWTNILRRRQDGYRIALVGYSLGNSTATYLQRHLPVDLLLAIAESSLGRNYPIEKKNTRRSVLWCGPDTLSNAGVRDGFDAVNYVDRSHLLMDVDPRVVSGVLNELRGLLAPERRDEPIVVANVPVPVPRPRVPRIDGRIVGSSEAAQPAEGLPPAGAVAPDVTCTACWGFTPSLGAAESDPWMQ